MIKNYLKIAWRNLVKGKLYSVINITGLAVGITCCLLIALYVYQELRYDRFNKQADHIYRVVNVMSNENRTSRLAQGPKPLAPFLKENFPEVKQAVRLQKEDGVVRLQNELFKEQFLVADKGFLDMFSFRLIQGNAAFAFSERNQILLTESVARKFYGSTDVVGKSLELRIDGTYYQASVGGILEDPPEYSSIRFKVVIPIEYWKKVDKSYALGNNWGTLRPVAYVLLAKKSNPAQLAQKIEVQLEKAEPDYFTGTRTFELQPLTAIHFDNSVDGGLEPTANVGFIYISAIIAVLILLIACINFMSISIGRSSMRAREVGMRKVLGARRVQVMKQFWGETFMIVAFSLLLALLLFELLLPYFGMLTGKSLVVNWSEYPMLIVIVAATVMLTGLLAGSYPALYLSKFQPAQVFRNKINVEGKHLLVHILSGVQFALAITLIIGTLFMNQQMNLLANKNLGFDDEFVIQLELPYKEGKRIIHDLRASLASESSVQHMAGSWQTLGTGDVDFYPAELVSGDQEIKGYTFGAGAQLPQTLGLKIIKGRDFRNDSNANEILVNQKLVKAFGWDNPLGKKISRIFTLEDATIVGVVNDFHFQSLHHPVGPLVMYPVRYYAMAYIRLNGGRVKDALNNVGKAWKEVAPGLPFNYTFLDQTIEQQYRSDNRWVQIVQFASVVAVFLACMGLFGLATLATSKRTKEISIRKILGATAVSVAALLSKDFLKPVVLALLIAIPASFLLIKQWLQEFAYKIDLSIVTYVIAVIVVISLAVITVSWQSIKAALANPVDSLRSE